MMAYGSPFGCGIALSTTPAFFTLSAADVIMDAIIQLSASQ